MSDSEKNSDDQPSRGRRRQMRRFADQQLVSGIPRADVADLIVSKFSVSPQTARSVIRQVESDWAKAGSEVLTGKRRMQSFAKSVRRREHLYRSALADGDHGAALRADQDRHQLEVHLGFSLGHEMVPAEQVRDLLQQIAHLLNRTLAHDPDTLNAILHDLETRSALAGGGVIGTDDDDEYDPDFDDPEEDCDPEQPEEDPNPKAED